MSADKVQSNFKQWFSTYGLITSERILGRYQIKLSQKELITALKTPCSFYHKLIEIPLKNVLNGIILQQAHDYQVYAQKLFIDYVLSGETAKSEATQGATSREGMENERQQLALLAEEFHKKELEHNNLIAKSQETLMKIANRFNEVLASNTQALLATLNQLNHTITANTLNSALIHALVDCDVNKEQYPNDFIEKMNELLQISLAEEVKIKLIENLAGIFDLVVDFSPKIISFREQTEELHLQANSFRSQFYETILRVVELIKLLPEYKLDPLQDEINREALYFDKNIGML